MHIICLTPIEEGVYNDHESDNITAPPDGWAYIPEDFPLPSTFPRLGSIEAEEVTYTREVERQNEVTKERDTGMVDKDGNAIMETYTETETVTEPIEYTMMTVTAMTEGIVPEPEPEPKPIPTIEDLADENKLLKEQVAALSDQNDFQEELIVELANIVYA